MLRWGVVKAHLFQYLRSLANACVGYLPFNRFKSPCHECNFGVCTMPSKQLASFNAVKPVGLKSTKLRVSMRSVSAD